MNRVVNHHLSHSLKKTFFLITTLREEDYNIIKKKQNKIFFSLHAQFN